MKKNKHHPEQQKKQSKKNIRNYFMSASFVFGIFFPVVAFSQTNNTKKVESILKAADAVYSSNPDSSYLLYKTAEGIATSQANQNDFAEAKMGEGRYLLLKSKLVAADSDFNEALRIYNQQNNTVGLAKIYNLKSILQRRIGNETESLSLLQQSIQLYRKAKDTSGIVQGLLNISLCYDELKKYDKAQLAITQIKALFPHISVDYQYYYYQDKGILNVDILQYKQALEDFKQALNLADSNKMIDSKATILMKLGMVSRLDKNFSAAKNYLAESEEVCINNKLTDELLSTYGELIRLSQQTNNYEDAFNYLQAQNDVRNKIMNIQKINQINELEKKLSLSEKQKELDKEKLFINYQQSQNKHLLYFIFLISLFFIASVVLIFRTRLLKNKVEEKSSIIETKQKEILDSINYAKRIQKAILPEQEQLKNIFPESFIFFQPKDIVSGDFYWFNEKNDKKIIAAVDCTGHGVPGAFMSMIGNNFLNEIVNENEITKPADILNLLREKIIFSLKQTGTNVENKDGMDVSLISLNGFELEYAGANNSLWLIRNKKLQEYKADKQPVGFYQGEIKSFTNQHILLEKGDIIYLFTDGYADQFGGEKGKKFKYKQLQELLIANSQKAMSDQKSILEKTFHQWKDQLEQVDDVLLIGIRF